MEFSNCHKLYLPWAAKIEPMVAVEKRQIYSGVFGPFMMKGDGWPNSPNGISETRSVCYSAERSSKKEKRGDGPLSQDTIEKILGILKTTLESCTAAVYSRIREGIYVVEDALKRKLNKQRADLLQHQKTQATSIHMLGSSSPILSGNRFLTVFLLSIGNAMILERFQDLVSAIRALSDWAFLSAASYEPEDRKLRLKYYNQMRDIGDLGVRAVVLEWACGGQLRDLHFVVKLPIVQLSSSSSSSSFEPAAWAAEQINKLETVKHSICKTISNVLAIGIYETNIY